ncbi:conjugal transfer protein TrbL family protein [Fictibacillus sp. Mic-4]|nr:hypothetical protein [Escherichia coli]
MSIFNPVDSFKDMLNELAKEFGRVAMKWLKLYVVNPTDFSQHKYLNQMYDWVFIFATTIAGTLLAFNLLKIYFEEMQGGASRGSSEVIWRSILGVVFACSTPWILTDVLLKINNLWVNFIIDQGLKLNGSQFMKLLNPTPGGNLSLTLMVLITVVLFLVLCIQYIIRQGELMYLLVLSPAASITMVNGEMNIFPAWWREACAVVFMQAFQVTGLWLIYNMIAGGSGLADYIKACGLIFVLLKGPGWLRQFIYSTGAGRGMVNAAGGVGKFAMYKMMTKKALGG